MGSGKVVGWLIVVNAKETTRFSETPTGYVNSANVMMEVAVDAESVLVTNDNALTISYNACLLVHQRHFDSSVVKCHTKVGVYLYLTAVTEDRQQFTNDFGIHSFVVGHDAEIVVKKVADQQVAALARELVETSVECHVVLVSCYHGVTSKWWNYRLEINSWSVCGEGVHCGIIEGSVIIIAQEVVTGC